MYEVATHRVQEVRVFVNYVLVIEKELIRLEQLLLLDIKHILLDVVPHYLVVLHVVIRDSLPAKHYEIVCVNHVQAHEPYATVHDCVKDHPEIAFHVQLLYRRTISSRLVPYGVDVAVAEGAAVGAADCLL